MTLQVMEDKNAHLALAFCFAWTGAVPLGETEYVIGLTTVVTKPVSLRRSPTGRETRWAGPGRLVFGFA